MQDVSLRRWQSITVVTLFTGYAGYYVCRSNLSVAAPLILAEYASEGFTKESIGAVASAGVLLYALGKIVNGITADFIGGRFLFLFGMFCSVLCTWAFGLAGGVTAFMVLWAINRYAQSMGWVSLVKTSSRWFPVRRHATILGILSMSYLLGDAAARWYLGQVIGFGVGWRALFFISGATLGIIGLFSLWLLKASPADLGLKEPEANPDNVFGDSGNDDRPANLADLLLPLFRNFDFWLVCLLNAGLTLVRETFNFWTPTFLNEAMGQSAEHSAKWSMLFPLVGAAASLSAGYLSDRLGGLHGRIAVPSLALLIASLAALGSLGPDASFVIVLTLVGCVAFGLIAPYSFLSGVIALDLGGKKGSATAAGLIDSAGYFGAVLSGIGIGSLAERYGWSGAFLALAAVAALSAIAAVVFWLRQEYLPSKRRGSRDAENFSEEL